MGENKRIISRSLLWISEVSKEDPLFPSQSGGLWRRPLDGLASAAPLVAILMISVLIGLFLWMTEKERRQELHVNLLRDTLWVEQALRFQLGTHQDNLLRLAADLAVQPQAIDKDSLSRMRHLVANHAELLQITWFDEQGEVRAAVPPHGLADAGAALDRPPRDAWSLLGVASPAWSPPRKQEGRLLSFLRLPVNREDGSTGLLEATLALDELLATQVPWWIAEHYQVSLTGLDGEPLVKKSNAVGEPTGSQQHSMSFDPPFHGIFLTLAPYRAPRNPLHMLLIAGIVGLALLTVVNLGLLALHFKRRRQAEQALRNEQLFRQAMQDSVTVGLRARALDGKLLFANPAFCRMVGWPAEEIIGMMPPMPWWRPDMLNEIQQRHLAQHSVPRAHSFETVFQRRDGVSIQVMVYEAPLIDDKGVHVGWMASILDISDRRQAEAQASRQADRLQQTGRLITMGEMASTLAHELNQPLAAIASYCASCQNLLAKGGADRQVLATLLENLAAQNRRAGLIIRRIHDFVRKREPVREQGDLARLVRDTVGFAEADARRQGVLLRCQPAPVASMPVRVDPVLIEQVLLNLIRNAIEATLENGVPDGVVDIGLEYQDDCCIVSVADHGAGVAPEMMERIFTPFATTKKAGMGMGLNICRSILEQHHGQLWFEARAGGGAVFLFSLPAWHGAEGASATLAEQDAGGNSDTRDDRDE
ncbi:PAS/PAC sensor signal transduction histidine kinase [Kerstersia gyiorum]|uniref:histidine kinase n=1 Tax=Kerstersia gyiorum TaxID=206506 RepID=A0A4Q7MTX6_9BURK|nr:PAS/PAC sensor signal transduction histidine kinase [Kerstersia gyiorum]